MVEEIIVSASVELMELHGRVFPWMVADWLDFIFSERTARRYMSRMAVDGRLKRIGQRRGYVV